jgi:GTP cyclohydrolase II
MQSEDIMTDHPPADPRPPSARLSIEAETNLPTRHGQFRMLVFRYEGEPGEHVAMVKGEVAGARDLPVRVHSECLTSEIFGSLKCDCREQLHSALSQVERAGRGIVIYLRQEGRGIGLVNKIKAYALQERGADTIQANLLLGLPAEGRRYDAAAALLRHLGAGSIKLITNNPDKLTKLASLGVAVTGRLPVIVPANPHSAGYLRVKREQMSHLLSPESPGLPEDEGLDVVELLAGAG